MSLFFLALRLYPFWAIPLALVMGELGWYFRRKGKKQQWFCWSMVGFLGLTTLLWLIFRGDLYADRWSRAILGIY